MKWRYVVEWKQWDRRRSQPQREGGLLRVCDRSSDKWGWLRGRPEPQQHLQARKWRNSLWWMNDERWGGTWNERVEVVVSGQRRWVKGQSVVNTGSRKPAVKSTACVHCMYANLHEFVTHQRKHIVTKIRRMYGLLKHDRTSKLSTFSFFSSEFVFSWNFA